MSILESFRGQFLISSAGDTVARLNALFDDAQWVCIATGYGRTTGLDLLPPRFATLARSGKAWILSSDQREQLSREFVERISELNPEALRVLSHRPTLMHAKTWIIQPSSPSHTWVLTGSWNLTRSGLSRNDDIGAWLIVDSSAPELTRLTTWFRDRWAAAVRPSPDQFDSERDIGNDEPEGPPILREQLVARQPLDNSGRRVPEVHVPQVVEVPQSATPSDAAIAQPVSAAPASTVTDDVMAAMRTLLATRGSDLVRRTNATFAFKLANPSSTWTLDLKNGAGTLVRGAERPAECVFELSDADFLDMARGHADAMRLFTSGKLHITGNVMASQKLTAVLAQIDGAAIAYAAHVRTAAAPPAAQRERPVAPAPFSRTALRLGQIARYVAEHAGVAQRTNSLFEIRLRAPDSVWALDLRVGRASIRAAPSDAPDCTIEMRDADFHDLCDGRSSRETLYFSGRMTVSGNAMRAAGLDLRGLVAALSKDEGSGEAGLDEDVDERSTRAPMLNAVEDLSLAPFQQEALDEIRKHHRAQKDDFVALLTLPTGGGKTRVAVWWLLEDIVSKGGRVLWIAHRQELIEQARATFEEHRGLLRGRVPLNISYLTADAKDPSGNVVLASTMTLLNNTRLFFDGPGRLSLHGICFDEAHHATADATKKMLLTLRKRQSVPLLGLTATPYRMDAGETTFAHDFFEARVAYRKTFGELVASRFLARPTWDYLTRPEGGRRLRLSGDDISEIRRRNDFTAAILKRVAGDEDWNNSIADQWRRRQYGQTIVFASNTDHIKELRAAFKRRAGVDAVGISYESEPEERDRALDDFARGRVPVIINVGILTEGADIDGVNTVVMARPTLSRILYRQMIGRAARRGRDRAKENFFVLDCVQNSLFHHDTDLHLAGDEVRAELEAG